MDQPGATWKGSGELKALRRIVGGSAEDDEDALAPVGHNRAPQAIVYETTAQEIALEEQALVVERELEAASRGAERAGRELSKLREYFCAVEMRRRERILRVRAEGGAIKEIAAQFNISLDSVRAHIKMASRGRTGLGRGAAGRFTTWASARFKLSRKTIIEYIHIATHVEHYRDRRERDKETQRRNQQLVNLIRASQEGKVAPEVFRRGFLALGDRGAPSRTAVACWIISLEAGTDDPQEVARWFAKAIAR